MSLEKSNDFFKFHAAGDVCDITIHNNLLDFEQLMQIRDLRDIAPHRIFHITGRSSIEAYFCLGFLLTHWQASMITGYGAKGEKELCIDLRNPAVAERKKWLTWSDIEHGEVKVESNEKTATRRWSAEELELAIPTALPISKERSLHITGNGSVWMYMQLGISAALRGVQEAFISKPQLPYEIHIHADGYCESSSIRTESKHGVVVGILGDPNSGKSVFSRNFALAVQKTMPSWFMTWIYDCDLASPTPEWYLQDCEGMREQRTRIKRAWTPELERKTAGHLKNLRNSLDLVLADMPGGKPCGQDLDRIPSATRGEMMSECDAFIVLCRADRADEIFHAWHQALGKYHLEDRIIARFITSDPDVPFAISPLETDNHGFFHATMSGLDRSKDRAGVVQEMSGKLRPLIRCLSYVKVAREAQTACVQALSAEEHCIGFGAAVRNAGNGLIFTAGERSSDFSCTGTQCIKAALSQAVREEKSVIDVVAFASTRSEKNVLRDTYRLIVSQYMQNQPSDFDVVEVEDPIHFCVFRGEGNRN